uniref:Uncharacterized protein n=1 Tax=Arundo donax TaxID=35708 RepID=A0A0A9G9H4_ARUDO
MAHILFSGYIIENRNGQTNIGNLGILEYTNIKREPKHPHNILEGKHHIHFTLQNYRQIPT